LGIAKQVIRCFHVKARHDRSHNADYAFPSLVHSGGILLLRLLFVHQIMTEIDRLWPSK
jgi:hypothetical protein